MYYSITLVLLVNHRFECAESMVHSESKCWRTIEDESMHAIN